ncbi:hypothetical protein [Faecalibacterium sp. 9]|uniref:hypothetical protein n=1 Tax=Faecalibacterium sp. 9 TaxID=3402018 RepID=UPI003AB084D9
MAFDFDVTGNTKLDTSGFTNGISSMTVAAGNRFADFVKSASSKMAELVTSSVDIGFYIVQTCPCQGRHHRRHEQAVSVGELNVAGS